jgi:sec-independent protein translocase protein TatB
MFEMGFQELVLIAVIGLLVLGPQRLPKVAAEIGKWVGRARRTASQLRRQLEREIELSELATPPTPPSASGSPTQATSATPMPPTAAPTPTVSTEAAAAQESSVPTTPAAPPADERADHPPAG